MSVKEPGAPAPTSADKLPDKPRLRPIEAFPMENPSARSMRPEDRFLLALRDPSGVAEETVTLPPLGAAIIDLCDGSRTIDEICAEFLRRYHNPVGRAAVEALLQRLDDALLLDSPSFRSRSARLFNDFAALPTRPARLAGKSYPEDPAALREAIAAHFQPPRGPGVPAEPGAAAPPRMLLVPHVDFARGGPAYAWAYYPLLAARALPDLIVLLGTSHTAQEPTLTLTRKHFETPLGLLETDQALVDRVLSAAKAALPVLEGALLKDEYQHRGEHSLEYQAVWLRALLGLRPGPEGAAAPRILPVLCGSLQDCIHAHDGKEHPLRGPFGDKVFGPGLQVLGEVLQAELAAGRSLMLVCSAELAHVGPRFGDKDPLSEADHDSLERRDKETLRPVLRRDADGWFAELRRERDRRRVSGLSAIYAALHLSQVLWPAGDGAAPLSGGLRCYAQVPAETGSVVSIASVVFP